jgi:hypothetical protein
MTQQQGAANYPDLLDFEWTGIEWTIGDNKD